MKRDKNESSTNNIVAIIAVVVLIIGIAVTLVVVSPSGEDALTPIAPADTPQASPTE